MHTLRTLLARPFIRSVAIVASGTAAAQAVALVFSPVITRMYGPEAYGMQGIFMSALGLLLTAATLNYPLAIVLPKRDEDARGLAKVSLIVGLAMALMTLGVIQVAGGRLLTLLNAEAISSYSLLLPLGLMIAVIGQVLSQWLVRRKAYAFSARFGIAVALMVGLAKVGAGLVAPSAKMLILVNVVGSFIGTTLTFLGWRKLVRGLHTTEVQPAPARHLLELANRYRDFPLLRTPQMVINALSQSLPLMLLAGYFGAGSAGQYGLALSVLGAPAGLVGNSVMTVFYPRINEAIHAQEDARSLIIRATLGMTATVALPFLVVVAAGPFLFGGIFGTDWRTAGEYARWLSPWIFLQYVNKPAVAAIPALGLQGELLVYEFFSTGTKVAALWLGFAVFRSAVAAIALFSIVGVVAYGWLILWVIDRSRSSRRPGHGNGEQG